jgi:hypothetical protein
MAANAAREADERAAREWQEVVTEALAASSDELVGMGYMSVFHFARGLKAWGLRFPDAQPVTGEDAAEFVEKRFERARKAQASTGEDAWDALDLETDSGDVRGEFVAAWDSIRVPAGQTLWEAAEQNARNDPYIPENRAKNAKYVVFVSIAAHLQRALPPGENIALPVGKLATILKVSEKMVSQYRAWAVTDELLKEVVPYSREKKRATRFRFALEKFPAR